MKMTDRINLSSKIKDKLPEALVDFMKMVAEIASIRGQTLYLVGGGVRDLLLGLANLDFDLVVEGDAIELAKHIAGQGTQITQTHPRFKTAKLKWGKWSIDLATARSETYSRPGALPDVKPGSLKDDLFRRDFTINTIAINLEPGHFGELIDPYGGSEDIERKLIRVLHEKSFIDDATRIWRGLRYEQRLNFQLEPNTLKLLRRDISMLDTISGDRIRHEIELVLQEQYPENILRRAEELNALQRIYPALKGNGWLREKYEQVRQLQCTDLPIAGIYLALLTYQLTNEEDEKLISYLKLPKSLAHIIRDTAAVKSIIQSLSDAELKPVGLYNLLHGHSQPAIVANLAAAESHVVKQHIQSFIGSLRHVRPLLKGNDLIRLGVGAGPQIKEILSWLQEARLDGRVTTKQDEESLVYNWLASNEK